MHTDLKIDIKKFLEDNWDLLKDKNFDELYKRALQLFPYTISVGTLTGILRSVEIDPLEYFETTIPDYYMVASSYVGSVNIHEGIIQVGDSAFLDSKITSIKLPTSLNAIGKYAFANTKLKNIEIGENLLYLGEQSFRRCPLEEITIKSHVFNIVHYPFINCKNLKRVYIARSLYEDDEFIIKLLAPDWPYVIRDKINKRVIVYDSLREDYLDVYPI